jgi:DNA-binding NarL/FixJ family response regulator
MADKVGWSILIVEDDVDYARRLARRLRRYPWPVLVEGSVAEARAVVEREPLAGVLLDWILVGGTGKEVLDAILLHQPGTPVLVLTAFRDLAEPIAAAQSAGAEFAWKGVEDLDAFVSRIALRESTGDVEVLGAVAALARRLRLSPRRAQILAEVQRGRSYEDTARELGISVATVQTCQRLISGRKGGSLVRILAPGLTAQISTRRDAQEEAKKRRCESRKAEKPKSRKAEKPKSVTTSR